MIKWLDDSKKDGLSTLFIFMILPFVFESWNIVYLPISTNFQHQLLLQYLLKDEEQILLTLIILERSTISL